MRENSFENYFHSLNEATFEADVIISFLRNLDDRNKVLLLTGGLKLPFQGSMSESIARFIMVPVYKLVRIRERLVVLSLPIAPLSHFMRLHAGL